MPEDSAEVVIIGAGVVGLACAAVLARCGDRVLVLEQTARLGQETSSRNSGVIHAGLYYPEASLKATLCVRGRGLLYARAQREDIAHRKLGKLVVATDDAEAQKLEALERKAQRNGAGDVRMLSASEVSKLEPRIRASAALLSPETGIIDAHALMQSYWNEAQRAGAELVTHTRVTEIMPLASSLRVATLDAGGETHAIEAGAVINAAGLGATAIAESAGLRFEQHLCKGDYFRISSRLRGLVSRLVYPMPSSAGLGIHLTLDLDGGLRAGPDTEYVDAPRYDVNETKRAQFGEALRRYVPELQDEDLTPDFAGLRPKLHGPETVFHDFVVTEHPARFIHLLGIESPGLTASEAIAERVARFLS